MKQPPPAALALLSLFLAEPERDAVLGDLLEEFQIRASALWFWGQVFASLGYVVWLGVRRTPGRVIASVLAGYAAMAAGVISLFAIWFALGGPFTGTAAWLIELPGGFVCSILGGYLAARISRGTGVNGMIGLCVFTLVMGLLSLTTEPWWKELALMACFLPGMLLGGYLRARQRRLT
jgi:hypothetical protein